MNTSGMKETHTHTHIQYVCIDRKTCDTSSSKILKENLEVIIRVLSYSLWVKTQLTEHSGN